MSVLISLITVIGTLGGSLIAARYTRSGDRDRESRRDRIVTRTATDELVSNAAAQLLEYRALELGRLHRVRHQEADSVATFAEDVDVSRIRASRMAAWRAIMQIRLSTGDIEIRTGLETELEALISLRDIPDLETAVATSRMIRTRIGEALDAYRGRVEARRQ